MVLIADQRPEVRAEWRAALEGDGRRVVEAESREAGLAAIEAGGIGLLVTGEMEGFSIRDGVAVMLEPVEAEELTGAGRRLLPR